MNYIKTHYTGPRVVVAGAGAVEHGALVKLADAAFGALPSVPASGLTVPVDEPGYTGSQLRFRDDDLELAHFAIGFETGGWTNAHAFPLMVMQTLLGTWDRTIAAGPNMTSPLCRKAGELNIAHSITSFNTTYKDTGLFGVYAVAEPTHLWELSCEVLFEMVRLCHSVTADEVACAKTQLKNALCVVGRPRPVARSCARASAPSDARPSPPRLHPLLPGSAGSTGARPSLRTSAGRC